ncbi:MAG: hypothetical protein JWM76_1372 [Pseudonocardiales bacterium]|nr:hypothetical protein [Pseudonocardiales bacterium]
MPVGRIRDLLGLRQALLEWQVCTIAVTPPVIDTLANLIGRWAMADYGTCLLVTFRHCQRSLLVWKKGKQE